MVFLQLFREKHSNAPAMSWKVQFTNWDEALQMAEKGDYDGVLGAYQNEERTKTFDFTDPITTNQEVFFAKKGSDISYQKVEDLKEYKIGALKGGAEGQELKEKGLNVEESDNELSNFKKLEKGGLGLCLFGKQNYNYQVSTSPEWKSLKDSVEMIDPPFKTYELFCALTKKRKDSVEIVQKFNEALQSMKSDGSYNAILKRFNQEKPQS